MLDISLIAVSRTTIYAELNYAIFYFLHNIVDLCIISLLIFACIICYKNLQNQYARFFVFFASSVLYTYSRGFSNFSRIGFFVSSKYLSFWKMVLFGIILIWAQNGKVALLVLCKYKFFFLSIHTFVLICTSYTLLGRRNVSLN